MTEECDICGKHALQCWCEYKYVNGNKPWINAWSRNIRDQKIKENNKFIEDNYVCSVPIRSYDEKIVIKNEETVKSFDHVQNDCEGVLNFNKENQ